MSGIKSQKVGKEIKGSKRSEKLRKAKFTPAGSDTSELVLSKLLLSIRFGAVLGRHMVVGFNAIMRQLERDHIDAVIISQQAPASIMQMLYEAVLMRNMLRKNTATNMTVTSSSSGSSSYSNENINNSSSNSSDGSPQWDSTISLFIMSHKSVIKLLDTFKMKRLSCLGLRRHLVLPELGNEEENKKVSDNVSSSAASKRAKISHNDTDSNSSTACSDIGGSNSHSTDDSSNGSSSNGPNPAPVPAPDDDADDHVFASMITAKEILSRHSIAN